MLNKRLKKALESGRSALPGFEAKRAFRIQTQKGRLRLRLWLPIAAALGESK